MQFVFWFFFSFLWFGVTNVFLIARKSLYDVDFKGNFFFSLLFFTLGRWMICRILTVFFSTIGFYWNIVMDMPLNESWSVLNSGKGGPIRLRIFSVITICSYTMYNTKRKISKLKLQNYNERSMQLYFKWILFTGENWKILTRMAKFRNTMRELWTSVRSKYSISML